MEHAKKITLLCLGLGLLLNACSTGTPNQVTPTEPIQTLGPIAIGSKDFTEEYIIAQMYAQLLENAHFDVDLKLNLGGTPVAHEAILRGDIDLYPEYTSTGLLTVLKADPLKDPQEIYAQVKSGYEDQFGLTWLDPAPFNNTQALAMTWRKAGQLGIVRFSDLAIKAPELILGGPAEFIEREDGLKALQAAYGGFEFKEIKQLGAGSLRYQALLDGQIDVVVAFGTDGQIRGYDLLRLDDDKDIYPIYNIAPVVRQDTLEKYPQIAEVLNPLAPLLTDKVMSELNWQVDGPDKKEPAVVAQAFLRSNGLLDAP